MRGGDSIRNAAALVEGERISAVGAGLPAPSGAEVIELGEVTLLPGLVDCRTHPMASSAEDYGGVLPTGSQAEGALGGAAVKDEGGGVRH